MRFSVGPSLALGRAWGTEEGRHLRLTCPGRGSGTVAMIWSAAPQQSADPRLISTSSIFCGKCTRFALTTQSSLATCHNLTREDQAGKGKVKLRHYHEVTLEDSLLLVHPGDVLAIDAHFRVE